MVLGAPVWSPDGSRIAVDALLLTGPEAAADIVGVAILSYPVDSSERRSVISSSPVWYEMGAARLEDWSPDGKELTVSRLVARNPGTHVGMRRETYALDLATGSFQDLAELPSNIWNVAYSPVR